MSSIPEAEDPSAPAVGMVLVYHERLSPREGALDARDEEECFTSAGRRVGLWLTTETARGPSSFVAEVDTATILEFEVTEPGSRDRIFVVPAQVVARLGFRAR